MEIEELFTNRKEKIISTNPRLGLIHNGFVYTRYITTDQGDYKETELGEIFKFNKGVLENDSKRWEKISG